MTFVEQLPDLIWTAGIIVLFAIIGPDDPLKEPYRIDVCLVASGPSAEDMSTNIWSDQVERYFEKYPGSYCGKCGAEEKCPK